MATRQRTPNAMDLLLGAVPKPAPAATSPAAPADGHAPTSVTSASSVEPAALLEEADELLPTSASDSTELSRVEVSVEPAAESTAAVIEPPAEPVADVGGETPADEPVETSQTVELPAADTVPGMVEPELSPAPKKARRSRKRAPAAAETSPALTETVPAGEVEVVAAASALSVEKPAARQLRQAARPTSTTSASSIEPSSVEPSSPRSQSSRRRDPDEVLEPAYVPIKVTVSIPAVVLSELIRTVQTIRRMTGRRQPVNQGTVIAAALEMAFEEFRKKGATSELVDKLRIE